MYEEKRDYVTLQEHQSILTNATVPKNSEIGHNMVFYENFFFTNLLI